MGIIKKHLKYCQAITALESIGFCYSEGTKKWRKSFIFTTGKYLKVNTTKMTKVLTLVLVNETHSEKIDGAGISFIFSFSIVSFSKCLLVKGNERKKKVKCKSYYYWTKCLQIFLTYYTINGLKQSYNVYLFLTHKAQPFLCYLSYHSNLLFDVLHLYFQRQNLTIKYLHNNKKSC